MQVYNNAPAFAVWVSYTDNVTRMRQSMNKLSTGLRIVNAGDDPAGLAMSERLRAQYRNSAAAGQNIQNMVSYLQTADTWLQKVHDIIGRMAELAVQSNDGTKSQVDRENLQEEFSQMQAEIKRITTGSTAAGKYNNNMLFQGRKLGIQVGADHGQLFCIDGIDLRISASLDNLGGLTSVEPCFMDATIDGIASVTWGELLSTSTRVDIQSLAVTTLGKINLGIDYISKQRAILGANQSRLNHTLQGLRNYESNIRASESQIRDVDVALETTEFSKYSILTQVGTAMLAQANALPQGVLQMIG